MVPEDTMAPASTTSVVTADVLAKVTKELGAIVGEQYLLGLEVTMETSFNDDLALESVNFVALAAALQQCYGDRVDFVAFIAGMELDELIDLKVGQLVTYIADTIAAEGPCPDHDGEMR